MPSFSCEDNAPDAIENRSRLKRVDLSPRYVEPELDRYTKERNDDLRKCEIERGERIWQLVRQAAGEVVTSPSPETEPMF